MRGVTTDLSVGWRTHRASRLLVNRKGDPALDCVWPSVGVCASSPPDGPIMVHRGGSSRPQEVMPS